MYISAGPDFSLFLKRFYDEKEDEEKRKLLPYLAGNILNPYGYTFLSYLVVLHESKWIKEALQIKDVRYMTDKNETTPLMNAIKFKNFKVIRLLLEFISQSDL